MFFITLFLIHILAPCNSDRSVPALVDLCSRFPNNILCTSSAATTKLAPQPPIAPAPVPIVNPVVQPASSNGGKDLVSGLNDVDAFCSQYKNDYDTSNCKSVDMRRSDTRLDDLCSKYERVCLGGAQSGVVVKKPMMSPEIAEICLAYKSSYETFCDGTENAQTHKSCMQYKQFCAGREFPPRATAPPALPAGSDQYCAKYQRQWQTQCNTGKAIRDDYLYFCKFYYKLCMLVARQQSAAAPINPNFGGPFNPLISIPKAQVNPAAPPLQPGPSVLEPPPGLSNNPPPAVAAPVQQAAQSNVAPAWPGLGLPKPS
uniref:Uncharacterized protein n=1 Tax=Romanomermis culicivorax TaxID=13658 RepID=A0A915JTF3_ROMCU